MGNNNHDVDIANDFLTYKVWEKRRWLKRAKILLFFVLVVSGLTFMYVRAYTQKKAFVENQFAGAVFEERVPRSTFYRTPKGLESEVLRAVFYTEGTVSLYKVAVVFDGYDWVAKSAQLVEQSTYGVVIKADLTAYLQINGEMFDITFENDQVTEIEFCYLDCHETLYPVES